MSETVTHEDPDYPTFRRRLREAHEEADRWRAHTLDLVLSRPGARQAAWDDLVADGLVEEPVRETCRERRARAERARRARRRVMRLEVAT